jgi:transcriptional regulator with PAS, ATPase and Fis domain
MALLEIRDTSNAQSVVELGEEALAFGLDRSGKVVWTQELISRKVGEVRPEDGRYFLRHGDDVRLLEDGTPIRLDGGIELVYRSASSAASVRVAALNEIGRLLGTLQSTEDLFDRVLDSLLRILRIRNAGVALFDDDEELSNVAVRGDAEAPNPKLASAVVESGAAVLTSEAEVVDQGSNELSIKVRSILCAPLRNDGRAQGILYTDNRGRTASFSNDELDFVSALAHLASFALDNLTQTKKLREENTLLRNRLRISDHIVLVSAPMVDVYRKVEKVAGFDATVLITGESGVGKEWVAHEIHNKSARHAGPFVAVNCAAIPDTLLESELFGYAPQSGISGADPKGRAGRFERADGGTIFLDEIGELRGEVQAKLLRVLQDKKVDRLNDTVARDVDLHIVVATNRNLEQLVEQGIFRQDLFYRLNVVTIEIPPLRERRDDIMPLAEFFICTYPGPDELRKVKISRAATRVLESYQWPGNVREIKNCIEQALILGDGKIIRAKDLPDRMRKRAKEERGSDSLPALSDVERDHIARVLGATGWNKAKSARILGISKPTLYEKIRVYGLTPDEA